ncbi:hypothetical protein J3Q64DRAFT_1713046 [Phycomyces blakesleeanus]|uniref:Protein Zds1 C-terminal domain-containing protein n=1 Tax=Phycomyces blakesleeanus TaxID=4837 RepID=A0ABR3BER2_PHYBL
MNDQDDPFAFFSKDLDLAYTSFYQPTDNPLTTDSARKSLHLDTSPTTLTAEPQKTIKNDEEDNADDENTRLSPMTTAGLTRALSLSKSLLDDIVGETRTKVISIETVNPSHLFWVPASQHPEIAPAEFEKYLQGHGFANRTQSQMKRRKSILSMSFTALEDLDKGETEGEGSMEKMTRTQSSHARLSTDHDLLDEQSPAETLLAAQRRVRLRRSVSLQLPSTSELPLFLVFDRNSSSLDDSPVLVPKADRPLFRRGARTRFQRNSSLASLSLSTPTRMEHPKPWHNYRRSEPVYPTTPTELLEAPLDEGVILQDRPVSFEPPTTTYSHSHSRSLDLTPSTHPLQQPVLPPPSSSSTATATDTATSTTSSSSSLSSLSSTKPRSLAHENATEVQAFSVGSPESSKMSRTQSAATRERKSTWSWAFWSDDKAKKSKTTESTKPLNTSTNNHPYEHDKPASTLSLPPVPAEVVASSKRFGLSSLFSKKSTSKHASSSSSGAGADTASFATQQGRPPKDFQLNKINQSRLPIHIERAVYRLSHIKLANPRRPLKEQVLISNLMFWYLSIISAQQQEMQPHDIVDEEAYEAEQALKARRMLVASKKKKRLVRKEPKQRPKDSGSLQTFMHVQSKESTGFVVPDNYLNPNQRQQQQQQQHRQHHSQDEESDDRNSSDSSGDDEMPTPPESQSKKYRTPKEQVHPDEDDLPLGLYRKT